MHSMTPELKDKLNLYELEDMDDEEFRDVLTDNATLKDKLLPIGESNSFGNLCSLEAISHSEINNYDKDNKFLLTMFDMHDIKLENAKLIQSRYYLHTQAEDHIKIDIVWDLYFVTKTCQLCSQTVQANLSSRKHDMDTTMLATLSLSYANMNPDDEMIIMREHEPRMMK